MIKCHNSSLLFKIFLSVCPQGLSWDISHTVLRPHQWLVVSNSSSPAESTTLDSFMFQLYTHFFKVPEMCMPTKTLPPPEPLEKGIHAVVLGTWQERGREGEKGFDG